MNQEYEKIIQGFLDKQKKGKKKMKSIGRIEVPTDVFIKVLRNE